MRNPFGISGRHGSFTTRVRACLEYFRSSHAEVSEAPARPRILIAEDNPANRKLLLGLLAPLDCQFDTADDGRAATTAAESARYDLILMDRHMPELDGIAASRAIRESETERAKPRVPIVLLSGDIPASDQAAFDAAGIDALLAKPCKRDDLIEIVQKFTSNPGQSKPDGEPQTLPVQKALSETKLIDESVVGHLLRLRGSDGKSVLSDVTEQYASHAPELIDAAKNSLENADSETLFQTAHSLKSSSAGLGAVQLAETCAQLEVAARENRLGDGRALLGEIAAAVPVVVETLTELTTGSRPEKAPKMDSTGASTVLVVDDDPGFRLATSRYLSANGFAVCEADSGQSALECVVDTRPDLILADGIMGEMSGFKLCRYLKRIADYAEIPVIMVTSLDDSESVNKAFESGASNFTTKPVNYPLLVQQIRFTLRASQAESELREHRSRLESAQSLGGLGYWCWEPTSGSFELSPLLTEMLGERPSNCDICAFLDFVDPKDRRRLQEHISAAQAGGHKCRIQYRISGSEGRNLEVRQVTEVRRSHAGLPTVFATVQDITLEREAESKIRKLAFFDSVTGIASRNYFMQTLEQVIHVAHRKQERFALLFLDLDGFKDVNDSLGHDLGDRLLQVIAQRLAGILRDGDFIARLGGDEFCVIARNILDDNEAAAIARRCLQAVGQPVELIAQRILPGMSVGIAHYPDDGKEIHALIRSADSAMYAAKQAGKNRYAFYNPDMTRQAEERLSLENDLRLAFDDRQFQLHYQPQVSLQDGSVVGFEALIRWQHPEHGLIFPNDFVPVVERIGLIDKLGEFVVDEACAQLRAWQGNGAESLSMAVNLSPLQLLSKRVVTSVRHALKQHAINPNCLTLEITESFSQDYLNSLEVLEQLHALGTPIAIDDFGIGYSSLGSLKKLPVQCLKIDRLFVSDIMQKADDTALLGAIIGLAHALGLNVVAEGAETLDQVEILSKTGCDRVQGYYFSRPVPADEAAALLKTRYPLTLTS